MPLQLINLGTAPNDGTGDSLRDAGVKINKDLQSIEDSIQQKNAESIQSMEVVDTIIKVIEGQITTNKKDIAAVDVKTSTNKQDIDSIKSGVATRGDELIQAMALIEEKIKTASKLPAFSSGQHVDQIEILTGHAEEEHILFTDANVDRSNTFTFDLAEEVILPAIAHIQLSPDGHPKMATMTGEVVFTAADTPVYGGGRTGPNPKDYYFLCSISSDGREIKCTLTNPQYLVSARSSLQLSVYESGIPYNVASEEHVKKLMAESRSTIDMPMSGSAPSKSECEEAAAHVTDFHWAEDKDFYIKGHAASYVRMYLIKYRANGDNDVHGTDHVFWIEALTEAM